MPIDFIGSVCAIHASSGGALFEQSGKFARFRTAGGTPVCPELERGEFLVAELFLAKR
jgi:hypothetical protein